MRGRIRLAVGTCEGRRVGVGEVQVVGELRMLRSHRRDALDGRQDALALTMLAHHQVLLLHIAVFRLQHEAGYLEVGEAALLHLKQQRVGQVLQAVVLHQLVLQVYDVLQSLKEPLVNLGQLLNAVDGVAFLQCLCDSKDAEVGGVGQCVVQIVELGVVVAHEAVHTLAYHAQTLLNHLLEGTSDGHDFAHGLHAGTNVARDACKLGEVPARNLTNHIVE